MPRNSNSSLLGTQKTAAGPHLPRDLASKAASRCPKTPADVFVLSLVEGLDLDWGKGSTDIRRNIVLKLWVEEQKGDINATLKNHPMFTLKVMLQPGMFIRPTTVTLDACSGDIMIEALSTPLWLQYLPRSTASCPLEFTRVYTWVVRIIEEVLATSDTSLSYLDSWLSLAEYVGHIKALWDEAERPRPTRRICPRPARRAVDASAASFNQTIIDEGLDQGLSGTESN